MIHAHANLTESENQVRIERLGRELAARTMEAGWMWQGTDGREMRGISEQRAKGLVEIRGGTASQMAYLMPVETVALPILPPSGEFADAASYYGPNRFNND